MLFLIGSVCLLLGTGALFVEFKSPALMASANHFKNVSAGFLFVFIGILFMALEGLVRGWGRADRGTHKARTEQGYVIKRKDTGYTMTVGVQALSRAHSTGDYEYIGPADHGALRYTGLANDGSTFDGVIPAGHVFTGAVYQDERLNHDLINMMTRQDDLIFDIEMDAVRRNKKRVV